MSGFTASDVPAQDGKTFLVTGANAGIGFETAKVLAARGALFSSTEPDAVYAGNPAKFLKPRDLRIA